ncbi:MAG: hypothetical protein LUH07_02015 [Lachnospiraceae bacterium]|nr:hypothetical protein [Lachnospiraceae bacterium]
MRKKMFIIIGSIIFICLAAVIILTCVNGRQQSVETQSVEDQSVGGSYVHWYHLGGTITQIDDSSLTVELAESYKDNSWFDEETIYLDCSKSSVSVQSLSIGDEITFYFFINKIDGQNVYVEDISVSINYMP